MGRVGYCQDCDRRRPLVGEARCEACDAREQEKVRISVIFAFTVISIALFLLLWLIAAGAIGQAVIVHA